MLNIIKNYIIQNKINHKRDNDLAVLFGSVLTHFDRALIIFLMPLLAETFCASTNSINSLLYGYGAIAFGSSAARFFGVIICATFAQKMPITILKYSLIVCVLTNIGMVAFSYNGAKLLPIDPYIVFILLNFIGSLSSFGRDCVAKLYVLQDKSTSDMLKASCAYPACGVLGEIFASALSAITYMDMINWQWCFILSATVKVASTWLYNTNAAIAAPTSSATLSLSSIFQARLEVAFVTFSVLFSYITYYLPFVICNNPGGLNDTFGPWTNTLLLIYDLALIFACRRFLRSFEVVKIQQYAAFATLLGVIFCMQYWPNFYVLLFCRIWIVTFGVIFLCPEYFQYQQAFRSMDNPYLLVGLSNWLGSVFGKMIPVLYLWLIDKKLESLISLHVMLVVIFLVFLLKKIRNIN